MNFVEKHSKLLAAALCLCASVPILSTVHAYEVQPGWHSDGDSSYYVLDNHQKAKGLTEIENDTYYFNQSGEMQTGWQNISNQTYYFDNDGKAVTGKTEIQGTTYNFPQKGSLNQGWGEDETYYNEKGFKTTSAWVNEEAGKYYLDENGNRVKNTWKEIDGSRYYFDADGRVVTGQFDVDGATYYTDDQGIFRTGWVDNGTGRVYYNADGSLNIDGLKEIDGVLYAFNSDGTLQTNTTVDGYDVNENGVATPVAPVTPAAPETDTPAQPAAPVAPVAPEVETPAAPAAPEAETPAAPEAPAAPEYVEPSYDEPTYVEPDPTPDYDWTPEPEPTPAPAPSYDVSSTIASAALAQLGVGQDCTMLVTNALAAAGISHHGWPESYASLGSWTSNPVPGDIIIYSGHVAVYIGNGQAVHGGWNGNQTVIWSVNCANSLIGYIHVG